MTDNRPSKDEYFLDIAAAVAKRSTCLRRQYGAVIVKRGRIIATGYNGSAQGIEHCTDRGVCWREAHGIPHGERYEKCRAVHAETNAIVAGYLDGMYGATLYLVGFENGERLANARPCEMCSRLIRNSGVAEVVTDSEVIRYNWYVPAPKHSRRRASAKKWSD